MRFFFLLLLTVSAIAADTPVTNPKFIGTGKGSLTTPGGAIINFDTKTLTGWTGTGGIGLTIGTTAITGGTNGSALTINSGILGSAAFQPLDADLTIWAGITPSANAQSMASSANYSAMRSLLGLVIGTDVLAPNGSGAGLTGLPVPDSIAVADAASDTTMFPLLGTDATGNLLPKTDLGITYNAAINRLTVGTGSPTDLQGYIGTGLVEATFLTIGGKYIFPSYLGAIGAAGLTGTVTATGGTTALVGTGTSFTGLTTSNKILVGGEVHGISVITDNTHITLTENQLTTTSGTTAGLIPDNAITMDADGDISIATTGALNLLTASLNTAGTSNFGGATNLFGGTLTITNPTISMESAAINIANGAGTVNSPFSFTQTWNDTPTTFHGLQVKITDTASASGSILFQVFGGAAGTTNLFSVNKSGVLSGSGTGLAGLTLSSIVPNTAPSAGQILVGNAGGTAYAPQSISGDISLTSAGVSAIGSSKVTNAMLAGSITNANLANSAITVGSTSIALGATGGTIAGLTLTSPVLNGLTSSGSTSLNFSGNSGTFLTSTGANTIGGDATFNGSISMTASGKNVTLSPTGGASVTIAPAGAAAVNAGSTLSLTSAGGSSITITSSGVGNINNMDLGQTTRGVGKFTTVDFNVALTGTATGTLTIPLGTVTLTGNLPDARNTVSNSTTTTMSGSGLAIPNGGAVSFTTGAFSGAVTFSTATGTNRSISLSNSSGSDNLGSFTTRPPTGTNVGNTFSIVPRGTGNSSVLKTQIDLFGTDYVADSSNWEDLLIRAAGTNGFGFGSLKAGSGTLRPMWFDATNGFSAATSNLYLPTSGGVCIGNTTDPGDNNLSVTGTLSIGGTVTQSAKTTTYNSIVTAGIGVVPVLGLGRVTAQTAANNNIVTYTAPASDGSYEVSMNLNVSAVTAMSASLNCDYTDESNTARTMIFPVQSLAGNFVTGGLITATGPYETPVMHIRVKASTAIKLYTSAGTYTGVTYTGEGIIKQTQ